jgi:toxin ParE1/3/4
MSCLCPNADSLDGPALRGLVSLRAYISQDNPAAAERQVERVLSAAAGLAEIPETGRPGRRARTRELVVSRMPYLVPYRIRGELIEIMRCCTGGSAGREGSEPGADNVSRSVT